MTNKPGRPSFKLHPARLKEHRELAQLTQTELGKLLFERADPPRDEESMKRSYGRIERTGQTSRETAVRLAGVLGPLLKRDADQLLAAWRGGQPNAPPDRVDEIERQLLRQINDGGNELLQQALAHHKASDNPVRELASHISARLEVAQLEQRSEQLAQLAELTGWTPTELQRPVSNQGFWLLITNTYGHRDTQIVMGVSEVVYQVKTEGSKWLDGISASDVRVELVNDEPWLRVMLQHPLQLARFKEFSFIRCVPSATGLLWTRPTEWDWWTLDSDFVGMLNWAFGEANFVKGYKADEQWPVDLGRLRLWVRQQVIPENEETAEGKDRWTHVAVHKGYLGEEPDYQSERRDRFREEGDEHALVTNWLASGFWDDVLVPLLAPFPADWWEIKASGSNIQVFTKMVGFYERSRYALEPSGRTYSIRLVEETLTGDLRSAPWRQKEVHALAERLQNNLKACQEQVAIGPQRPRWITAA